jgi:ABC-type branched-subunit amino acid transport system permease subunit
VRETRARHGRRPVDESSRPAFYALRSGGWRDWWTLLHPPYTAWHLSYVVFGAAIAPVVNGGRLGATVVGFFLGVGLTAHALDELRGRPLRTGIPGPVLWTVAMVALALAVALGVAGAAVVSWWLLAFVGFGAFIVLAYNLELFGGRFHSDLWFAASWGAFPALTAYVAQTGTMRVEAVLVAAACLAFSWAQRTLSTPVRRLRRRAATVDGRVVLDDGSVERIDEASLRAVPESALRALALALSLLAVGLAVARLT